MPESELSLAEVVSQFVPLLRQADLAFAAQLGAFVSWQAPRQDTTFEPVLAGADLDLGAQQLGAIKLGSGAWAGPGGGWPGRAF